MRRVMRKALTWVAIAVLALGLATACGCASGGGGDEKVTIGTLQTEDILPLWVAEANGIFEQQGVQAEIVPFQSATELIAGISSGEVDMAMTDPMVAASLFASGTDIRIEWITLGTTAEQGRFGIMVGPQSTVSSLTELAGVPIGVGSNTILEYVMDTLMAEAGVPGDQIVVEELQKLPVRYQAMQAGEVAAAALPGSLLALGEANGCRVVADDTGNNISQSIMVSCGEFASDDAHRDSIAKVAAVWNECADAVNENPDSYRKLLAEKANLPAEISSTYKICEYPQTQLPSEDMIEPVLVWMTGKNYLTVPLSYDATTGRFEKLS